MQRIEIQHEPSIESVQDYKDYVKKKSDTNAQFNNAYQQDIECTCCGQKAPAEAAAMIAIEDKTPTTNQLQQNQAESVWICADCYHYGVRPKYIKFGNIKWNDEGKRIKSRSESMLNHPW